MSKIHVTDLEVGQVVSEQDLELTRDTLVRYAGASGDFNPIHYRDDVAESVGLPGVLAHGMLTMGVANSVVADWLGVSGFVAETRARFTRPVVVDPQAGATLNVTATVATVDVDARRARVDVKVAVDGQTVLGRSQVFVEFNQ